MPRAAIQCLIIAGCICLAVVSWAQAGDLMSRAQAAWEQRTSLAKAREAADLYRQAFKQDPSNLKAAFELCRVLFHVGDKEQEEAIKFKAFQEGMDLAQDLKKRFPDNPGAHYWFGVCAGGVAKTHGITKGLFLVGPIKKAFERTIELDPNFEHWGSYRALGRMYFRLPGLMGGDNQKSIKYLRASMDKAPEFLIAHLFLAETLEDEGQEKEALGLLDQVIAGPGPLGWEPEWAEWKASAQKLKEAWQ